MSILYRTISRTYVINLNIAKGVWSKDYCFTDPCSPKVSGISSFDNVNAFVDLKTCWLILNKLHYNIL